jgi:hypothetical protein
MDKRRNEKETKLKIIRVAFEWMKENDQDAIVNDAAQQKKGGAADFVRRAERYGIVLDQLLKSMRVLAAGWCR